MENKTEEPKQLSLEKPKSSVSNISQNDAVEGAPSRIDMMKNDRRRGNRSTYVERSLFGTAIESLFGQDSIFSALDQPL